MQFTRTLQSLAIASTLALTAFAAHAADTIKVGLIAPFSGPFADYGKQMDAGIKAYMKLHGDTVAGRKIEIIMKDTTGPVPEVAKRLAQELVVRDKVDFLAGFGLTPEALAVAPIAEQAKKPMIIMNAATSVITTKSDYIARVSMTLPQISAPMGTWAVKNGIKKAVTLVADYGPGIDAETAFKTNFIGGGGQVTESIRVPLKNPEFAPYHPAHQGRQAGRGIRVRAGRRTGHRLHEGLPRARPGRSRHQGHRHRRPDRRPRIAIRWATRSSA